MEGKAKQVGGHHHRQCSLLAWSEAPTACCFQEVQEVQLFLTGIVIKVLNKRYMDEVLMLEWPRLTWNW